MQLEIVMAWSTTNNEDLLQKSVNTMVSFRSWECFFYFLGGSHTKREQT